jgi:hypothetical protein
MAKRTDEASVLSTLQDLLIFQMALAGVPQNEIRKAIGLDINRVNRLARLAKNTKKAEEK